MRYYVLEGDQVQVAMLAEHRGSLLKLLKNTFIPEYSKIALEDSQPCIDCLFKNIDNFLNDSICFAQVNYHSFGDQYYVAKEADNILIVLHSLEYSPHTQRGIAEIIFRQIGNNNVEWLDDVVGCFFAQTSFKEIVGERFPSPIFR